MQNASINLRHFRCDDDRCDDSQTTIICEVCPYVRATCVMFKVEGVERLSFCLGARNDGQAFTEEIFVTAAWDTTTTADDERSDIINVRPQAVPHRWTRKEKTCAWFSLTSS